MYKFNLYKNNNILHIDLDIIKIIKSLNIKLDSLKIIIHYILNYIL